MTQCLRLFVAYIALLAVCSGCLQGTGTPEDIVAAEQSEVRQRVAVAVNVDSAAFEQVVLKSEMPVLVDFWASWCQPCLELAPTIEEIAQYYEGRAVVAKVRVDNKLDDNIKQLAVKYRIESLPTLIVFCKGEAVWRNELDPTSLKIKNVLNHQIAKLKAKGNEAPEVEESPEVEVEEAPPESDSDGS